MKRDHNIGQISAELLLNYLYPEMEQEWIADDKGSFFRNYNRDILELYTDEKRVELSRDGFLKLLPPGLLSDEEDLKSKDAVSKSKEVERRMHLLNEAFLPIDTMHFRQSLQIERQVSELQSTKVEYLLKEYFGFDLAAEKNPYVKAAAVLLPYAKQWRGDFPALRRLIEVLFDCEVEMTEGRYSESDSTIRWVPMIRYDLLIPNLETEEYKALSSQLQPFADFIREWFIPAEVVCQVNIKEHGQTQQTNTRLTLDYNTELNK